MIIESRKLSNHKYSQCHINRFDDGTVQFVSYTTPVVEIRPNGYVYALPYFNYSATTRKQVGWFLREYTDLSYQYLKSCSHGGFAVHAHYGDIIPE